MIGGHKTKFYQIELSNTILALEENIDDLRDTWQNIGILER